MVKKKPKQLEVNADGLSNDPPPNFEKGTLFDVIDVISGVIHAAKAVRRDKKFLVVSVEGLDLVEFKKRLWKSRAGDRYLAILGRGEREDAPRIAKAIRTEQGLGLRGEGVGDEVGLVDYADDSYRFAKVKAVGKGWLRADDYEFQGRLAKSKLTYALVWPGEVPADIASEARKKAGLGIRGERVGDMLRIVQVRSGDVRACRVSAVTKGKIDVRTFEEVFSFKRAAGSGPMLEWSLVWPEEDPTEVAKRRRRELGFGLTIEELRAMSREEQQKARKGA
jgi:hypothetical protein